jgi:hypothetical protein
MTTSSAAPIRRTSEERFRGQGRSEADRRSNALREPARRVEVIGGSSDSVTIFLQTAAPPQQRAR